MRYILVIVLYVSGHAPLFYSPPATFRDVLACEAAAAQSLTLRLTQEPTTIRSFCARDRSYPRELLKEKKK